MAKIFIIGKAVFQKNGNTAFIYFIIPDIKKKMTATVP